MENERIYYNVKELGSILKIGRDKAYALMRAKGFPSIKIGKTYIVEKSELDKWADRYKGKEFYI